MSWTYKDNPTLMIVEAIFTGEITAQDLQEVTSKLIALEKEKGRDKFLIDTREMEFAASFSDLFDLPTKQYIEEGAGHQDRIAVILSTSTREREAADFYKIICRNCGWQVQTFPDRQRAIDWLTSGGKKRM